VVLAAAGVIAAAIVGTGALVALTGSPGSAARSGSAGGTSSGSAGGTSDSAGGTSGSAGGAGSTGGAYGGVQTATDTCPAAGVPGGRARCVKTAECWSGMIVEFGSARAGRIDCLQPHSWETFAIAPLPADAQTWNHDDVLHNPTVTKICSTAVLVGSLTGEAGKYRAAKWTIDVLPPAQSQYEQGARTFRCVAGLGLDRLRGTVFRPRT
jgi:hypothetical protein